MRRIGIVDRVLSRGYNSQRTRHQFYGRISIGQSDTDRACVCEGPRWCATKISLALMRALPAGRQYALWDAGVMGGTRVRVGGQTNDRALFK